MDESLQPDESQAPEQNEPTATSQENVLGPSILGAVSRILANSPNHRARQREIWQAHFARSRERLLAGMRARTAKIDGERILPMRQANAANWPGACSDLLPGAALHAYSARAQEFLTDESRGPADEITAQSPEVRARALAMLQHADRLAATDDPDYKMPTLHLSMIKLLAGVAVFEEQALHGVTDPTDYLAGRQEIAEAIVVAADAFNIAAIELGA